MNATAGPDARIRIRRLGRMSYERCLESMQSFTLGRNHETSDEIWVVEHDPVFTLGINADRTHLLHAGPIPVVATDRGGQITYHGPGQIVIYVLIDLGRHGIGPRDLVCALERSVIRMLERWSIHAEARRDAPGVYVDGAKLASLGLRIRRRCSYHGLALNVNGDLSPFAQINPCGFPDLPVTRLADLGISGGIDEIASELLPELIDELRLATERRAA